MSLIHLVIAAALLVSQPAWSGISVIRAPDAHPEQPQAPQTGVVPGEARFQYLGSGSPGSWGRGSSPRPGQVQGQELGSSQGQLLGQPQSQVVGPGPGSGSGSGSNQAQLPGQPRGQATVPNPIQAAGPGQAPVVPGQSLNQSQGAIPEQTSIQGQATAPGQTIVLAAPQLQPPGQPNQGAQPSADALPVAQMGGGYMTGGGRSPLSDPNNPAVQLLQNRFVQAYLKLLGNPQFLAHLRVLIEHPSRKNLLIAEVLAFFLMIFFRAWQMGRQERLTGRLWVSLYSALLSIGLMSFALPVLFLGTAYQQVLSQIWQTFRAVL